MVRARFMPKEFLALRKVDVTAGNTSFDLEIEVTDGPGCYGGSMRWFRCPRCAGRTTVIGTGGVDGRKCWRWRKRAAAELAPHTRYLVATVDAAE